MSITKVSLICSDAQSPMPINHVIGKGICLICWSIYLIYFVWLTSSPRNLYCSLAFLNNLWLALLLSLPNTIYILVQPHAFIVCCLTKSKSTNHQPHLIPSHNAHTTCSLRRENGSIHVNFEQRSSRWNPCKENKSHSQEKTSHFANRNSAIYCPTQCTSIWLDKFYFCHFFSHSFLSTYIAQAIEIAKRERIIIALLAIPEEQSKSIKV